MSNDYKDFEKQVLQKTEEVIADAKQPISVQDIPERQTPISMVESKQNRAKRQQRLCQCLGIGLGFLTMLLMSYFLMFADSGPKMLDLMTPLATPQAESTTPMQQQSKPLPTKKPKKKRRAHKEGKHVRN